MHQYLPRSIHGAAFLIGFTLLLGGMAGWAVGPWEVIAWQHAGFTGAHMSWTLNPTTMSHRLVPIFPDWFNDEMSSIQVGANVKVILFKHINYGGRWTVYGPGGHTITESLNDEVSSLIIYPNSLDLPLGAWLRHEGPNGVFGGGYEVVEQFFPIAQDLAHPTAAYPVIDDYINDEARYVVITDPNVQVELYPHANFQGVWKVLTLPATGACKSDAIYVSGGLYYYQLSGCNGSLDDEVSSLRVRWTGPVVVNPTSPVVTVPQPLHTGTTGIPDISGTWYSSAGFTYEIQQVDDHFTWHVLEFGEEGEGTISCLNVTASWNGEYGGGQATGKIILDEYQDAIRIEWANGVVFTRPPRAVVKGRRPGAGTARPPAVWKALVY